MEGLVKYRTAVRMSSAEDEFKKEKGDGLTQILCGKEGTEVEAGASVCSLLLAQSEVRPECLLMVLANSTVSQNPTYQIMLLYFYTVQGEDPYYTENGGGQGYSSGPGASPETQGKASVIRGAQENGTGQATSRNGHSARQHVVADTEL
ncbi:CD34 antigen [Cricetulus griseus]